MSNVVLPQAEIEAVAGQVLRALDERRQIPPLSQQMSNFDLDAAYRVTAAVCEKRQARGETPIGRKLGFTNRNIWSEYDVYAPIWGYVYDTTVHHVNPSRQEFDLSSVVEPRIEPEITLYFEKTPEPGMDEAEILSCIGWVAHGFEVVQSLFPGWKFSAADTVAAFGLHGALLLGPKLEVTQKNRDQWHRVLSNFEISLYRDGQLIDTGVAQNVLGGPLSAFRNFLCVISHDLSNRQLRAGEIVTTGTVTRAFPMNRGETWVSRFAGAPFAGLELAVR